MQPMPLRDYLGPNYKHPLSVCGWRLVYVVIYPNDGNIPCWRGWRFAKGRGIGEWWFQWRHIWFIAEGQCRHFTYALSPIVALLVRRGRPCNS